MEQEPLYTSKSTIKSLWQEYRIYNDRLEFSTLVGKMVVPFEEIEKFEKSESDVKGLFKGDLKLKNFRPALKLDWANFLEHVVLDKSGGNIHRVLFTPDNIDEFVVHYNQAIEKWIKNKQGV